MSGDIPNKDRDTICIKRLSHIALGARDLDRQG